MYLLGFLLQSIVHFVKSTEEASFVLYNTELGRRVVVLVMEQLQQGVLICT